MRCIVFRSAWLGLAGPRPLRKSKAIQALTIDSTVLAKALWLAEPRVSPVLVSRSDQEYWPGVSTWTCGVFALGWVSGSGAWVRVGRPKSVVLVATVGSARWQPPTATMSRANATTVHLRLMPGTLGTA